MKKTYLTTLVLSVVLLISCSKEDVNSVEEANLTQTVEAVSAKDQVPSIDFDAEKKGIYLGIVASKSTQSRGNIWINIGNDGRYTAMVKIVDGNELKFQSNTNSINDLYNFEGSEGSFQVDLSKFDEPSISNMILNDHEYFSSIVKNRSNNRAMASTGIFFQTGKPGWNGTWNIISDGTIINPNGFNGEGITSTVITKNGLMFNETVFETFSFEPCGGPPAWIPTLGAQLGFPDGTAAWGQTTAIGSSSVEWGLLHNTVGLEYADNACNPLASGYFSWTTPNGNVKTGEIYVDPPTN